MQNETESKKQKEKKKTTKEKNVKPSRVIASVFVLHSLFSLWLQSRAAQVTLIQPAEALAEIVLCWVMVELKLPVGGEGKMGVSNALDVESGRIVIITTKKSNK